MEKKRLENNLCENFLVQQGVEPEILLGKNKVRMYILTHPHSNFTLV